MTTSAHPIRSLSRRRVALIAAALLPVVLVSVVLGAIWGTHTRSTQIGAAIVNNDVAVTVDGQTVPMGRQLAGKIIAEANDNVDWTLADASSAAEGLKSGAYAVVVTIPKDFSAAATSFSDATTARQAVIDVTTSDNSAATDQAVVRQVVAQATGSINAMLTGEYLKNVYVGFTTMGDQFAQLTASAETLKTGAHQLASGVVKATEGAQQADQGVSQLAQGAQQLSGTSPALVAGGRQLADAVNTYTDGTAKLVTGVDQLADGLDQLNAGLQSNVGLSAAQAAQLDQLKKGAAELATGAASLQGGVVTYSGVLDQWASNKNIPQSVVGLATQAGQQAVADCREKMSAQAATVQAGLATAVAKAAAKQFTSELLASCDAYATAIPQAILSGFAGGAQAASSALHSTDSSGQSLVSGAAKLDAGASQLSSGVTTLVDQLPDQLASQLGQLTSSVQQLADGADRAAQQATLLTTGGHPVIDCGIATRQRNPDLLGRGGSGIGRCREGGSGHRRARRRLAAAI